MQEFCLCSNPVFLCGTKTVQAELVILAIQVLLFSFGSLAETVYKPANQQVRCLLQQSSLDEAPEILEEN